MLRFAALVSVLALSACGGGSSIAYSDLDQALLQARCERATRCKLFPDATSCMTYARLVPDVSLAAAIDADKVHFHGDRAQQCVDASAKQSCDLTAADSHIAPEACSDMYTGTLAGGASCSLAAECASGVCMLPNDCPTMGCCTGTCRPAQEQAKAGGACGRNLDCATGLVCGSNQMCDAPGIEGAACGSDPECGDGLGCVGVTSLQAGTCRALPHVGGACPYSRCADENLRCDPGTHVCIVRGLPGDACASNAECNQGMECDSTKHCIASPTLGMPCDNVCGGDSFCQIADGATTGTCVAPFANGTPCDGYGQCESFYCEQGPLFDGCKAPYTCF